MFKWGTKSVVCAMLMLFNVNAVQAQWTQIGNDIIGEFEGDNSGSSVSMSFVVFRGE